MFLCKALWRLWVGGIAADRAAAEPEGPTPAAREFALEEAVMDRAAKGRTQACSRAAATTPVSRRRSCSTVTLPRPSLTRRVFRCGVLVSAWLLDVQFCWHALCTSGFKSATLG